jgi:hypothetical protein
MVFKSLIALTILATGCLVLTSVRFQANARTAAASLKALTEQSVSGSPRVQADEELLELRAEIARQHVTAALLRSIVYETEPVISSEAAEKAEQVELEDQEKRARGFRAQLAARYGAFYLQQKLMREQIDRWEAIQTAQWHARADLDAVATKLDLSKDDAARQNLTRENDDVGAETEVATLGADNTRALHDYQRAEAVYDLVSVLAQRLYLTETPLERVHAERLTRLLKEKNPAYQNNQAYEPKQTPWPEVIAEARTFLPPKAAQTLVEYEARQHLVQIVETIGERLGALFPDK